MNKTLSFFERVLFEAPGTEATPQESVPTDDATIDTGSPPDMPDTDLGGTDNANEDMPPDMPDGDFNGEDNSDGFGDGMNDFGSDGSEDSNNKKPKMEIDEKVSNILNRQLYDKFLTLLNQTGSQLSNIKNNSEILHSLVPNMGEITEELKRLDESIRLYINDSFISENFSKNLLFFNQCLNALHMLNDKFSKLIKKGINS